MTLPELNHNNRLNLAYPVYDPLLKAIEMDYSLREMFIPLIRKHFPYHYLLGRRNNRYQAFLDCRVQTHPYFLYFDIALFYTTIAHKSIGSILVNNYEELFGYKMPKYMKNNLLSGPNLWFADQPWSRNFPDEEDLLYIAAGAYMLGLCLVLSRWPFLCHHEKFVVLFSSETEIDECLQQVYFELERLGLQLNQHTLCSGYNYPVGLRYAGQKDHSSTFAHFEKNYFLRKK